MMTKAQLEVAVLHLVEGVRILAQQLPRSPDREKVLDHLEAALPANGKPGRREE